MAKADRRPKPDAVETVIGPRAAFGGSLRSETSVRIDGIFEGGVIETPANVLIGEGARVSGDIVAKTVSIQGAYQGTIRADRAELLGAARVAGSINVNSFYMDESVQLTAEVNLRGLARTGAPRPSDGQRQDPGAYANGTRPIPVVGQRRAQGQGSGSPAPTQPNRPAGPPPPAPPRR
jgi:cytoskeletal protein CcmA (bactofilin family)